MVRDIADYGIMEVIYGDTMTNTCTSVKTPVSPLQDDRQDVTIGIRINAYEQIMRQTN